MCWLSGVGRRVERRRRLRNTLHEKQNHYHLHNYIIFYYIYLATSVTQKLNLKITQVFYKTTISIRHKFIIGTSHNYV